MPLHDILKKLAARQNLTADETQSALDRIFTGDIPREDIAAFLLGLHEIGETAEEILGAARSMRGGMLALNAPKGAIDIVGTGGDYHGTLNVSTAAAFVVAGCGVVVAKHGNRASTSLSGSSDALRELGVSLEPDWNILEACLHEAGIAFLFAPRHHPAMRHVADVRRELGVRTIFNLLGPLTNPANVKRHLIGTYDGAWLKPMAEALHELGSERAWLAHGHDGLDEIATTGATSVVELRHGQTTTFTLTPESFGLPSASLESLKGSDAKANAEAIRRLLGGERGPYRDIVLANAAAALIVSDKAETLEQGVALAAASLDSGAARDKLATLVALSNRKPA